MTQQSAQGVAELGAESRSFDEGDIIFAASMATPELLAFMIRYTSGVICVPTVQVVAVSSCRLGLPETEPEKRAVSGST